MHASKRPGLLLLVAALATLLCALPAAAQDKKIDKAAEGRANGLIQDAMEQDYLAVNFKAAEAKLQTAVNVCELVCSDGVNARIYRALGVVYAGMKKHGDAVEAFKKMIGLDAKLGLDPNYVNADVQKAFEEAKEASRDVLIEKSLAVLEEEPWTEQTVNTPVPVFVKVPEDVEVAKVVVRFRPPGAKQWQELELAERGEGYGGYVPCSAVEKEGELAYFVTAFDQNLDRVASAGSAKGPRKVKIKQSIAGRQPSLPGATPPAPCFEEQERLSCEVDDDCPGAMLCVDLYCVDESEIDRPEDPRAKVKLNWLTVQFTPDLMLVKSQDGVCNNEVQDRGQFSCFFGDDRQVNSDVTAGGVELRDSGSSNSTAGGFGIGSMRALVGYDRVFLKRYSAGARLGVAFLGHPDRDDGEKFLFIHSEVRGAFHFLPDPFADKGVRPYVFAGGGIGDFSALVQTDLVLRQQANPNFETASVDVYQTGGMVHVGGGIGVQYAPTHELALVLEVGARQTFPEAATLIVPSLGIAYGL